VAQAWIYYTDKKYEEAIRCARAAIERKRDCEGAYYILGRSLFSSGRYQEVADIADEALAACADDYNIYVPIQNALGALGKDIRNLRQQRILALETHLKQVPEDARARVHLAVSYATLDRTEDAIRETNMAIALRPNDAILLYNVTCIYCLLKMKAEALDTLRKAWAAGYRDVNWARRDPDLALLHGDPEFDKLYPGTVAGD